MRCCCYTVKAKKLLFFVFHSNIATSYYFIYKINLISHDYNPNSNFLSSRKTWFHKMEVSFRHLNNFSNSSAQTAAPSPAETPPPPTKPTLPSFAPTSHPAQPTPTPPGYSDGSPPLLIQRCYCRPARDLVAGPLVGACWSSEEEEKKMSGREREEERKKKKKFDVCFKGRRTTETKIKPQPQWVFSGSLVRQRMRKGRKKEERRKNFKSRGGMFWCG